MNCGEAELKSYGLSISFNSWFNPWKSIYFKIQKFSRFSWSFLVSSVAFCFLIYLIKLNLAYSRKLWLGSLECLQVNINFSNVVSFLWLLRWMLKSRFTFSNVFFFAYLTYKISTLTCKKIMKNCKDLISTVTFEYVCLI